MKDLLGLGPSITLTAGRHNSHVAAAGIIQLYRPHWGVPRLLDATVRGITRRGRTAATGIGIAPEPERQIQHVVGAGQRRRELSDVPCGTGTLSSPVAGSSCGWCVIGRRS
jgi:hypothetical protein